MDTQSDFGFKALLTHIVGDMAQAVCERNGESQQQKFNRLQAAAHTIMGFLPRDVIETMLAGHCVMIHEVMTNSIRDTLRGQMDSYRRTTRANLVALDKCFGTNLERLEHYRTRPSQGRRDEPDALPADVLGDLAVTEPAPRPEAAETAAETAPKTTAPTAAREPGGQSETATAVTAAAPAKTSPSSEIEAPFQPSPEAVAACMANPEAMAALEAGDAEAFARAMGVGEPSEAYLAAAASRPDLFPRQASGTQPREPATTAPGPAGIRADDAQIIRMVRDDKAVSGQG